MNELEFEDYLEGLKLNLLELDKEDLLEVILHSIYNAETDMVSDVIKSFMETNTISVETAVEVYEHINKGCIDCYDMFLESTPNDEIISAISYKEIKPEILAHTLVYVYPELAQQVFDELLYYTKQGRIEFDIRQYE